MQNRIYKTSTTPVSRTSSAKRLKFKEIPTNRQFNELNNKYELYKKGTPNTYSQNIDLLRVKNLKNEINMIDLPAVDYIINSLPQVEKDKQINQRNYDLYPNLFKQSNGRFKEMLSEKQQIKDFILWFQNQFLGVQKSNDSYLKKFQDKQTLIAAGYNQMIGQVSKISKSRAQILKMLWNRENEEVSTIIESLNGKNIKMQKTLLEQISKIHTSYQDEIQLLRKTNRDFDKKISKQNQFSKACIFNLRTLRKRIRKLEYMVKKLGETNISVKKQNLNLMEENIKLLMNIKQISTDEAVLLNYRKMQIYQQKDKLKHQKVKELIKIATHDEEDTITIQNLEEKKNDLYDYFMDRIKQNPDQKVLIKEEYFADEGVDCSNLIDAYFKKMIVRPNVQIQLLNQAAFQVRNKDKAINTDPIQNDNSFTFENLKLDKGVQVQLNQLQTIRLNDTQQKQKFDKKFFHIIDEKQQEQNDRQSKIKLIKHRLSRKNSYTLLQIQGINDLNYKLNDKSNSTFSYGKKRFNVDNLVEQNEELEKDCSQSEQSNPTGSQMLILNNNLQLRQQLCSININQRLANSRKSLKFKNILQRISQSYKENHPVEQNNSNIIKLNQEQQQSVKLLQIQDLIRKYLFKNEDTKVLQNPQKKLNKIFYGLYKNAAQKSNINFIIELLQVIKNNYGNTKSVIWKFLNVINIIRNHQNANSLLKIFSLLLKINEKFAIYDNINKEQLGDLYFKLFFLLTIKGINQNSFNMWKSCTTLEKIKSFDFMVIVGEYFSQTKRNYIQNKIQEFIAFSEHQHRSKDNIVVKHQTDDEVIVKLNPIILYILQAYLIEKNLYYTSYLSMVEFISEDGYISSDILIWIFDLMGFTEEKQEKIFQFIFPNKKGQIHSNYLKNDILYRCCVKFDIPFLQQLSVSTHSYFKLLPLQIQQNYYRMIGIQQWQSIKENLLINFKKIGDSMLYYRAFQSIIKKLQYQIKRGASIYDQCVQQTKIKCKQQIFSLFYKIIIIEAHKNILEKHRGIQKSIVSNTQSILGGSMGI